MEPLDAHFASNGSDILRVDIATEILASKGIDVLDRLIMGQQVSIEDIARTRALLMHFCGSRRPPSPPQAVREALRLALENSIDLSVPSMGHRYGEVESGLKGQIVSGGNLMGEEDEDVQASLLQMVGETPTFEHQFWREDEPIIQVGQAHVCFSPVPPPPLDQQEGRHIPSTQSLSCTIMAGSHVSGNRRSLSSTRKSMSGPSLAVRRPGGESFPISFKATSVGRRCPQANLPCQQFIVGSVGNQSMHAAGSLGYPTTTALSDAFHASFQASSLGCTGPHQRTSLAYEADVLSPLSQAHQPPASNLQPPAPLTTSSCLLRGGSPGLALNQGITMRGLSGKDHSATRRKSRRCAIELNENSFSRRSAFDSSSAQEVHKCTVTDSYVAESIAADMEEYDMVGDALEEVAIPSNKIQLAPDRIQPHAAHHGHPQQRRRWSMLSHGTHISEMLSRRLGLKGQDQVIHSLLPEISSASADRRRTGSDLMRPFASSGEVLVQGMISHMWYDHARAPRRPSSASINEEEALVVFSGGPGIVPGPMKNNSLKEARYMGLPTQQEETSEQVPEPHSSERPEGLETLQNVPKSIKNHSPKSGFLVRLLGACLSPPAADLTCKVSTPNTQQQPGSLNTKNVAETEAASTSNKSLTGSTGMRSAKNAAEKLVESPSKKLSRETDYFTTFRTTSSTSSPYFSALPTMVVSPVPTSVHTLAASPAPSPACPNMVESEYSAVIPHGVEAAASPAMPPFTKEATSPAPAASPAMPPLTKDATAPVNDQVVSIPVMSSPRLSPASQGVKSNTSPLEEEKDYSDEAIVSCVRQNPEEAEPEDVTEQLVTKTDTEEVEEVAQLELQDIPLRGHDKVEIITGDGLCKEASSVMTVTGRPSGTGQAMHEDGVDVECAIVGSGTAAAKLVSGHAVSAGILHGGEDLKLHEEGVKGDVSNEKLEADVELQSIMARPLQDRVTRALFGVDEWAFDSYELCEATADRPLSTLGFFLLKRSGVIEILQLPEGRLTRFLHTIEDGYLQNPYHGRTHAADVLRNFHVIATRGGLLRIMSDQRVMAGGKRIPAGGLGAPVPPATALSSPALAEHRQQQKQQDALLLLSVYLSAIIHDFDHRGLTNAFLITDQHPLALLYNDQSPMENHHVAAAFSVMLDEKQNFLAHLSRKAQVMLRNQMIQLVLGTDMKQHFPTCGLFASNVKAKALAAAASASVACRTSSDRADCHAERPLALEHVEPLSRLQLDEEAQLLVWKMALKCSDLGHLASPEDVHRRWVLALEEEMFRQGDLEKERGHVVSPLMDRAKAGITKSQPGFFNLIALPLFSSFVSVLPSAEPLLNQVKKNHTMWVSDMTAGFIFAKPTMNVHK
ncbi:hypothetical protein CEUSTIGMA_g12646.t1 [Chlamydomonas eustigma]|uniref:Phosphodiesterase n=1 Tax=Chlamydomonas eustigma TaxID=1157962 RepID=A0A250XQA2_9CHLO|nr:hypothetical protein CEUSTIGMA_g12646.t1 [Chlamydomonas eustigma]|eukprot:GAX85226.1 hypothetical protein CEUSTIGMA_g12646.t1 [Chlamydomonas eustigma]